MPAELCRHTGALAWGSHPCYFSHGALRRTRLPIMSNCWLILWHERVLLGNLRQVWQTLSNLCSKHDVDSGLRRRIVSEFVGCKYISIHTHFPNIHLAVSLINATVLGVSPPVSAVSPLTSMKCSKHALSRFLLWDSETLNAAEPLMSFFFTNAISVFNSVLLSRNAKASFRQLTLQRSWRLQQSKHKVL